MSTRLLLIDALNLIRRVYAGQPGEDSPEKAASARTSSMQSLRRALRQCAPTHAVCVFDGEEPSWRHELFPEYKAGHQPMPEPLAGTLPLYKLAFGEIGVASMSRPELEADDVIATIATKAAAGGAETTILSTDKIFLSLLPLGVTVRDHFKAEDVGPQYVEKRFGVRPDQLVDFLALAGDSGNNIRGVPGIGKKSAARLLSEHESLAVVLLAAGEIEGKLGKRLRDNEETALLCRRLVGLRTDLEVGVNLNELRYFPEDEFDAVGEDELDAIGEEE